MSLVIQKLLNLKEEDDFNLLRDASLSGEILKQITFNSDIMEKENFRSTLLQLIKD